MTDEHGKIERQLGKKSVQLGRRLTHASFFVLIPEISDPDEKINSESTAKLMSDVIRILKEGLGRAEKFKAFGTDCMVSFNIPNSKVQVLVGCNQATETKHTNTVRSSKLS